MQSTERDRQATARADRQGAPETAPLVVKKVELETVCGITSRFPENLLPEYVFAGKSNVGKSSLINALINRKALARVSAQPGKTQTVNFYRVNDDCYFVDLPGYSYANVPDRVRIQWGKMIERYLNQSAQIRDVFLLVDIRHEPGANDLQMADWIRASGRRPTVIATKLDKIKRSQTAGAVAAIRRGLMLEEGDPVIPFSALTKQGREEILSRITVEL